jgi:hypothetical protein
MACALITHGRVEDCTTGVGGLKAIYVINNGLITGVTYGATDLSDQITAIALTPATSTIYKFDLKGANTFEQTITSSRENGTTFVEQTLSFTLKGLDAVTTKQMKLLAFGRPNVLVQTNSNKFFLAGLENGMDVTTGVLTNGNAYGDFNGYTMTLVAMEQIPANHVAIASPYGNAAISSVVGPACVIANV